jgi:hypothetical protein
MRRAQAGRNAQAVRGRGRAGELALGTGAGTGTGTGTGTRDGDGPNAPGCERVLPAPLPSGDLRLHRLAALAETGWPQGAPHRVAPMRKIVARPNAARSSPRRAWAHAVWQGPRSCWATASLPQHMQSPAAPPPPPGPHRASPHPPGVEAFAEAVTEAVAEAASAVVEVVEAPQTTYKLTAPSVSNYPSLSSSAPKPKPSPEMNFEMVRGGSSGGNHWVSGRGVACGMGWGSGGCGLLSRQAGKPNLGPLVHGLWGKAAWAPLLLS